MEYQEFKRLAIKARWYFKQMRNDDIDFGKEISDLLSQLCQGDRNRSYSLLVAWVYWPCSEIYHWTVQELYDEIKQTINS